MEDQRRAEGAAAHRGGQPAASADAEEGLRAGQSGAATHRGGPLSASAPGRRTAPRETEFEPDPVVEAYKRDVDRTLLRQNLRRSATERVANLIALQWLAAEARRAGRTRERDPARPPTPSRATATTRSTSVGSGTEKDYTGRADQ